MSWCLLKITIYRIMITEFNIFESQTHNYLSEVDESQYLEYLTPIIQEYFNNNIPILEFSTFDDNQFNYKNVAHSMFNNKFYNKIYSYARDEFGGSVTKYANSFTRILGSIIRDSLVDGSNTNIYMKLENRLVDIFEQDTELYKEYYKNWYDDIPSGIHGKLQYIIAGDKYNL